MTTLSPSLVCFSHLRWNFVCQRPHHLMMRFMNSTSVYFVEEPVFRGEETARLEITTTDGDLTVITPVLSEGMREDEVVARQKELLASFFIDRDITHYIFWYCTPAALAISDHFNPILVVYDCMTEVSSSRWVSASAREREMELLRKADLVFTSGHSLYEAKKNRHPEVYVFPGSVDVDHFGKARLYIEDPRDQERIPQPRIGFFGVIDERIDLVLLEHVARRKPEWHLVMVGPVERMSEAALPKLPNIHWLGRKDYKDLPAYLSGWDLTMLPYVHNDLTRYSNPTKTPEYLAGGKPVIATPIIDVLRMYGRNGLVNIAGTPEEFVRVASAELENHDRTEWLEQVDEWLSHQSWDKTWQRMMYHVTRKLKEKEREKLVISH